MFFPTHKLTSHLRHICTQVIHPRPSPSFFLNIWSPFAVNRFRVLILLQRTNCSAISASTLPSPRNAMVISISDGTPFHQTPLYFQLAEIYLWSERLSGHSSFPPICNLTEQLNFSLFLNHHCILQIKVLWVDYLVTLSQKENIDQSGCQADWVRLFRSAIFRDPRQVRRRVWKEEVL